MEKIVAKLAYLCSRREYCSSDIMKKLRRMEDVSEEDAAKVLARLCEERYVDDLRYARAFARDKSAIAGWGTTKIAYTLRSKGIDPQTVKEALEEMDDERALRRMEAVIAQKWKALKDEDVRMKVNKVLRFAAGRGYGYEEVMRVIDMLRTDK